MAAADLLLAIDNGTQSLKALVFDPSGRLKARQQVVFKPYFSRHPGWAEQHPEVFYSALCTACRRLWTRDRLAPERLTGIALTTQRGSVINVDANGRPLRPAMLWLDQRKTHGQKPVGGAWGALFRLLGVSDTIAHFQTEAEANWIRTYQPDIWRQTHKYLLLSGYLTQRLTGRYRDSVGCCVGYLPFDYRRQAWARKWDWKWQALPMAADLLPELVAPGSLLGEITGQAAADTGLPENLPVFAAAADKACEVLGAGGLDPSMGCLSYGTTATINVTNDRYVEAVPFLPPYPSALPGRYTLEVQIYRGYWMVNWFKEEFGHREVVKAENRGLAPEALFDDLIDQVPAGAMGLMLQPYWTPGVIFPGPEAKGAVIGFGDVHTRAHLYRSILEGIAYALREGKERIEKRTRVAVTRISVSGGGSQSAPAMQLTADVFGLPTARPELYETSGLGAAISAAVGLGLYDDFPAAVAGMCRTGDVFEPDLKKHRLYNDLYHDVYCRMYKRLRPLYDRIRQITGYPE
jgi:sugar (pentulose or hexulose) kinase